MTALLALWIDGFKARVHYCESVVRFVDHCGRKKSILTQLTSLQLRFSLLIFDCSPASPAPRRRIFPWLLALLPRKLKDKQRLGVTGDTSAAGGFQSAQFARIDSDKEDFALPLCSLSRPFVAGWSEAAGRVRATPSSRLG